MMKLVKCYSMLFSQKITSKLIFYRYIYRLVMCYSSIPYVLLILSSYVMLKGRLLEHFRITNANATKTETRVLFYVI